VLCCGVGVTSTQLFGVGLIEACNPGVSRVDQGVVFRSWVLNPGVFGVFSGCDGRGKKSKRGFLGGRGLDGEWSAGGGRLCFGLYFGD